MQKSKSFTVKHSGIAKVIKTYAEVAEAFDPNNHPHPPFKKYEAIWDTGATGTVVTQKVVDECELLPIGMCKVNTAGGVIDSPEYLINLRLPNAVAIQSLRVTKAELNGDADILIGMNIISHGDFVITNLDGKTVFSFRFPSTTQIDFVQESLAPKPPAISTAIGRNVSCPCGSGKKYKKCCGK